MADRQLILLIVPGPGQLVNRLAAGIGQPENAGGFIEALPCRVIARGAEDAHIGIAAHIADERIAAGDGKADKRRLQIRIGNIIRGNMAADMMYRNERYSQRHRGRLGKVHAHQQRADETGRAGDSDGVNVSACETGFVQRAIRQLRDDLHMGAGGNLRHDAAVNRMQSGLRKDLIGENLAAVAHQGNGCLITGGFYGKNDHDSSTSFQYLVMRTASSFGAS